MKHLTLVAALAALVFGASNVNAADLKSGLQSGEAIGAFDVTKVAGAESDGVETGKTLCYRCRNGGRPQVMVFTRSADGKVVELVKALDSELKQYGEEKKLRAFVNLLSDSKDTASEQAKKLCAESKAENVPFVVPNEFENGPEDYGINAKAEVTVIVANSGKVVANYAVGSANELDVKAIVGDVEKMLN